MFELRKVDVVRCFRHAHDLRERMDPRIRSSGPRGRYLSPEKTRECVLEFALDGGDVGLAREASEGGAVVREVDPELQDRTYLSEERSPPAPGSCSVFSSA